MLNDYDNPGRFMIDARNLKPSFIRSVAHFRDAFDLSCSEFCVAGRSNVGKSSFISHVLNRKGLAQSSKQPGKTRVANYFHIDADTVWVDLPGYGYANAPGGERQRWALLMEEYFEKRENLSGCIWLIDIRHPLLEIDNEAYRWFCSLGIPLFAVLTKSDKVGHSVLRQHSARIRSSYKAANGFVEYSVESNRARDLFWKSFVPWADGLSHSAKSQI